MTLPHPVTRSPLSLARRSPGGAGPLTSSIGGGSCLLGGHWMWRWGTVKLPDTEIAAYNTLGWGWGVCPVWGLAPVAVAVDEWGMEGADL